MMYINAYDDDVKELNKRDWLDGKKQILNSQRTAMMVGSSHKTHVMSLNFIVIQSWTLFISLHADNTVWGTWIRQTDR